MPEITQNVLNQIINQKLFGPPLKHSSVKLDIFTTGTHTTKRDLFLRKDNVLTKQFVKTAINERQINIQRKLNLIFFV